MKMDFSFHVLYNALSPTDVKYYAYELLKGIVVAVAAACHVMSCHVMLISCHITSYYIILCHVIRCYVMKMFIDRIDV